MHSAGSWLLAVAILLCPPLSVVGLVLGGRRLSRRMEPPVAIFVAYFLTALAGLLILAGWVGGILVAVGPIRGEPIEPSQKARALAAGISEAMNCGALALIIAMIAAGWIGLWRWRRRRANPS